MPEYKGVAVFCEVVSDNLVPISAEGLGAGRKLADDLGEELVAILVGSGNTDAAKEAISYGADKAYVADDTMFKDYQADLYVAAMQKVIEQAAPKILILGQNDIGRDMAPRLAFRLETTVTMDCVELAIDSGSKRLLRTKPVYGGNALAVFTGDTDPQIVTIRTKAMTPLEPDTSKQGEIVKVDAGLDAAAARTKTIDRVEEEVAGIKLEDAEIVVAGGRGIGNPEGFGQLEELAKILKGAVGASRPPCDNNWVPDTMQVGLTGKIIAPEVYIAIAISGSSQHLSGCSGSKSIIAINKDPEANIFRQARFGAVGDWKKILPAFTAKIKELMAS